MTAAERRLWARLRADRFEEMRWRRQQPVGPYIVDFYCSDVKLVVELNGQAHGYSRGADEERDHWLESEGFFVLRFHNHAVLHDLAAVLESISTTFQSLRGQETD